MSKTDTSKQSRHSHPAREVLLMVMTIGTPLIWILFTVFVLLACSATSLS